MKTAVLLIAAMLFSGAASALELKSDAFADGGFMPAKYSCDGEGISPPLSWKDVPANTQTFALICYHNDESYKDWVCWIVFNIPAEERRLAEEMPREERFPNDMTQGVNDFGNIGYGGPCPLGGKTHRYVFRLYALDKRLDLNPSLSKLMIANAMKGHILRTAELTVFYKRRP